MGRIFDESGNRRSTGSRVVTKKEEPQGFLRSIPGALVRGFTSAGDVAASTGATIGKAAAKIASPVTAPIIRSVVRDPKKLGRDAEAFQRGLQKETKVMGTSVYTPRPYTSAREAVGETAEAVLDLGSAFLTGGAGSAVKSVGKVGLKQAAKNAATGRAAKAILADFAVGGAYGTASGLQSKDATAGDIARSAAGGAVLGAAFPLAFGAATRAGGKVLRAGSQQLGDALGGTERRLRVFSERGAGKAVTEAAEIGAKSHGDNLPFQIKRDKPPTRMESLAGKAADAVAGVRKMPEELAYQFYRSAPIKKIGQKLGFVDLDEDFQRAGARGYGEAENDILGDEGLLTKLNTTSERYTGRDVGARQELIALAERRMKFLDAMDRAQKGAVEGGLSEKQIVDDYGKFVAQMTPEQQEATKEMVDTMNSWANTLLLRKKEAGIISQESYDAIMREHQNYFPHLVKDYIKEEATSPIPGGQKTGKGIDVKRARGSTREVENPMEAYINYAIKANQDIERKKAENAFWRAVDSNQVASGGLGIKRIEGTRPKEVDIPEGMAIISRVENGAVSEYLVPEILAASYKGGRGEWAATLTKALKNTWYGKLLSAPSRFIRSAAVTYNPVFKFFNNPIRDISTALQLTDVSVGDIAKGFLGVLLRDDAKASDVYNEAARRGAFSGSVFREGMPLQDLSNELIRRSDLLQRGVTMEAIKKDSKGIFKDVWNRLGDTFENGSRLAVYKKALEQGATPAQAAQRAANATVDFNKSGELSRLLNEVVPFFNASVQGALNIGKAINERPEKFASRLFKTAIGPQLALSNHNIQYDSYWNIPDNERENNWIIMVGETPGRNFDGSRTLVPHYVRVPKMETQVLVGRIIDRALYSAKDRYPQEFKEWARETAKASLPAFGLGEIAPTGAVMAAELTSNYSYFRNAPIVPEWVSPDGKKWVKSEDVEPRYRYNSMSTSEAAKFVGSIFNWSPAKIDYVVKIGGLNDLIRTLDLGIRVAKDDTKNYDRLKGRPLFEQAAEAPFLRSILRAPYYGESLQKEEVAQRRLQAETTREIERNLERRQ